MEQRAERLQRPRDAPGDRLGAVDRIELRHHLARDQLRRGDHSERRRPPRSTTATPWLERVAERALEDRRQRGLAERADADRGHRHADLHRRDVLVDVARAAPARAPRPSAPSSRITSRRARRERTSAYSAITKNALTAISTAVRISFRPFTRDRRSPTRARATSRCPDRCRSAHARPVGATLLRGRFFVVVHRAGRRVNGSKGDGRTRGPPALAQARRSIRAASSKSASVRPPCGVRRQRQADLVPAVQQDVGVVVGDLGRLRHAVDERHRVGEVRERELAHDRAPLAPRATPLRRRAAAGSRSRSAGSSAARLPRSLSVQRAIPLPYSQRMRIVSLVPHATELLFALGLGAEVVGVTHECDYPGGDAVAAAGHARRRCRGASAPARSTPRCASARSTARRSTSSTASALAALEPELIVTQALCPVCAVSYEEVADARQDAALDAARDRARPEDARRDARRRAHDRPGDRAPRRGRRARRGRRRAHRSRQARACADSGARVSRRSSGSTPCSSPATGRRS